MPFSRAEQVRLDAEEADRRESLRRRLMWQYGPEEGERKFQGACATAQADIAAWQCVLDRSSRHPPGPSWTRTAVEIARGAYADLQAEP